MSPGVLLFGALSALVGALLVAAANRQRLAGLSARYRGQVEDQAATASRLADLRREHDRLRTVLEGLEDGVIAVNAEQRVELANPSARRLLGTDAELSGRPLVEVLPVPQAADLLNAAREGATSEVETEIGGRRLSARAVPLGRGALVALRDVTELRRLERIRQDFVANVSHELRTPVTVIGTHAETLLASALEDPPAARRFVEGIQRHATRMGRIVADLLDLSRIEAGSRVLGGEPVDVGPLLRAVAAELLDEARGRDVTLSVDAPDDLLAAGDADAIDQVVFNLADNAVKYTPAGGAVAIVASPTAAGRVRVEVRDDGPGVPEEHRARLFERFYRVDKGRSRAAGGTGLGLSIVKHLVESMDGAVGYAPREPTGSVFWFELDSHTRPDADTRASQTG